MNKHIVYLTREGANGAETPAWQQLLVEEGFVFLTASEPSQSLAMARTYPLVGLILDFDLVGAEAADLVARLTERVAATSPPIIGLLRRAAREADLAALAKAGFHHYISSETPPAFVAYLVKTCQSLQSLRAFEQAGMDIKSFALESRKLLHDLSQPLAVVSGRLQLMQSKAADGDPQKETLKTMMQMMNETTKFLRELQELQRKYS